MSVKGKNFKIKNAQINPNITSDGLIFHIDPVYSTKSDTNYLYDDFYNFSNLHLFTLHIKMSVLNFYYF